MAEQVRRPGRRAAQFCGAPPLSVGHFRCRLRGGSSTLVPPSAIALVTHTHIPALQVSTHIMDWVTLRDGCFFTCNLVQKLVRAWRWQGLDVGDGTGPAHGSAPRLGDGVLCCAQGLPANSPPPTTGPASPLSLLQNLIAFGDNAAAASGAAEALARLCGQFLLNNRVLVTVGAPCGAWRSCTAAANATTVTRSPRGPSSRPPCPACRARGTSTWGPAWWRWCRAACRTWTPSRCGAAAQAVQHCCCRAGCTEHCCVPPSLEWRAAWAPPSTPPLHCRWATSWPSTRPLSARPTPAARR